MPYGKGSYGSKVGRPAGMKLVRKHESGSAKGKPMKIQMMTAPAMVKKMKSMMK